MLNPVFTLYSWSVVMEWNNAPVRSGLPATWCQNLLVKTKYSFLAYRDQLFFLSVFTGVLRTCFDETKTETNTIYPCTDFWKTCSRSQRKCLCATHELWREWEDCSWLYFCDTWNILRCEKRSQKHLRTVFSRENVFITLLYTAVSFAESVYKFSLPAHLLQYSWDNSLLAVRRTGEEKNARGNLWDVYSNSVSGFLVSLSLCCVLSPIALSQNKLRPVVLLYMMK